MDIPISDEAVLELLTGNDSPAQLPKKPAIRTPTKLRTVSHTVNGEKSKSQGKAKDEFSLETFMGIPCVIFFWSCVLHYVFGISFVLFTAFNVVAGLALIVAVVKVFEDLNKVHSEAVHTAGVTRTEKNCSSCKAVVPLSSKVGDTCPHCRVRWGAETTQHS